MRQGVLKVIEDDQYYTIIDRKYVLTDIITGYGVAESVKHFYDIHGGKVAGKRVTVQRWGSVGSAGAYYLAQIGVKVVGIIDRVSGLINEGEFSLEGIRDLFLTKDGNALNHPNILSFNEVNGKIWNLNAEVFIPRTSCRLITEDQFDRMINSGMEVISVGANVPFADP